MIYKKKQQKIERKFKKKKKIFMKVEIKQNICRIKLIFFNFIFFTFQMNNIFNYLKRELSIQHAKYNYDR